MVNVTCKPAHKANFIPGTDEIELEEKNTFVAAQELQASCTPTMQQKYKRVKPALEGMLEMSSAMGRRNVHAFTPPVIQPLPLPLSE